MRKTPVVNDGTDKQIQYIDNPIVAVFKEKINWVFLIIAGLVIGAAAGKFF